MGLLTNKFQEDNVIVEKLEKLLNWSRSTSPWFFQFGTACCAIEMMAAAAPRHDIKRIGFIPRSSPRQALSGRHLAAVTVAYQNNRYRDESKSVIHPLG